MTAYVTLRSFAGVLLCIACLAGTLSFASTETELLQWQEQIEIAREARNAEDWPRAEQAFASAVAYAELLPSGDPHLTNTLFNWAVAAGRQREFAKAIELQTRAVELQATSRQIAVDVRVNGLEFLGGLHHKHGELSEAERAFREALTLHRTIEDHSTSTLCQLLFALSTVIQLQRPDDAEALELLQRRAILEETSGDWTAVAQYHAKREAHVEAVESFVRAIAIERRRVVIDRARLARLLSDAAEQHLLNGDILAAETAGLEALELQQARLGTEHPFLAFTLPGLARVYVDAQRYREAESHLLRSEELTRAAWGDTGCAFGCKTKALLLEVYHALGDEEALRARQTPESVPADPDPVAERIEKLDQQAAEQRRAGRYENAQGTILEALALRKEHFGPESSWVVKGLQLLGDVRGWQGDREDAIRHYERCLEIIESREQTDDPWLATILSRMAKSYLSMGRYDEAEPLFLRELAVRERLGQKLLAARILQKLAEASRSRSDFATAATNHAEAAEAWQEFAGPQAPEVRNNLIQLAQDYISLQRYDEAETLLIDLLDEEEQAEAHPDDLLRILRPLVGLYQKQGRGDRVAAIRNRVYQLERLKKERRTTAEAAV